MNMSLKSKTNDKVYVNYDYNFEGIYSFMSNNLYPIYSKSNDVMVVMDDNDNVVFVTDKCGKIYCLDNNYEVKEV